MNVEPHVGQSPRPVHRQGVSLEPFHRTFVPLWRRCQVIAQERLKVAAKSVYLK